MQRFGLQILMAVDDRIESEKFVDQFRLHLLSREGRGSISGLWPEWFLEDGGEEVDLTNDNDEPMELVMPEMNKGDVEDVLSFLGRSVTLRPEDLEDA